MAWLRIAANPRLITEVIGLRIFLQATPFMKRTHPIVPPCLCPCSPLVITHTHGSGILTRCPSPTPFGLGLGSGLPREDEPAPGNLGIPAEGISTPLFVTHVRIISGGRSTGAFASGFDTARHAPLPSILTIDPQVRRDAYSRSFSARGLSTSQLLRTVQMVAASKPTSWLSPRPHVLSDLASFRGLTWRSGLFPSRLWSLAPTVSLPCCRARYSEFDRLRHPVRGPRPVSALPPCVALAEAAPKGISGGTSYHPA